MVSGSSGELTRGAPDHRMGETQPWGHVAEPWVAHARRRRRTGRDHVAGGPRDHTGPGGAQEAHVAVRLAYGGYSGPWLGSGGGNANALPHPTI